MNRNVVVCALVLVLSCAVGQAQDANVKAASLPHLIRFSGTLAATEAAPRSTTVGITFSLYTDQSGGAPLWQEVQNVTVDATGHYSVVLGANSQEGVPAELFATNEARWLGVQVEQAAEQPRVLLVSVPYALKAGDAESVGGHPLSDFVLSTPSSASTSSGTSTSSGSAGTLSSGAAKPKSSAPLAATTINAVAKFSDTAGTVTDSQIIDNGTGVGIGGAGTTARLTVGAGAASTASEEALHIDGSVPVIRLLSKGNLRWGWLGEFPAAGQSTFWNYASGKPLITLNSGGLVGIGTLNPSARLTVGDGSAAEEALHINGTVPIIRLLSQGTLRWGWLGEFPTPGQSTFWNYTSGKPLLTLNSAGRVGVGATNPSSRLTVGDGVTGDEAVNIDAGGNASLRWLLAGAPKWAMIGEYPAAGGLGFYNYALGSSVLTLSGNGNVGIGNPSPGQRFSVGGMIESTTGGFKFPDGSVQVTSSASGGGTVTSITAGTGLSGGTITTSGTLAVDPAQLPFLASANTFTNNQSVNGNLSLSGSLSLPNTTSASVGVLTLGGVPFLHNFGTNNTFVGASAGNLTMSSPGNNTAVGATALTANTTGKGQSAFGNAALAANTTGTQNSAFGASALTANTTGIQDAAFGNSALISNTSGNTNSAFGTGALYANTTASLNSAFGFEALFNNTTGANNSAFGEGALFNLNGGANNLALGGLSGSALTGIEHDNIYLDNVGVAGESQTTRIGTGQTATFIAGVSGRTSASGVAVFINTSGQLGTITSSRRFKHEIVDMGEESDLLMKLRPVAFYYKPEVDETQTRQYGLVAEEVAKVAPQLVVYDKDGAPQTVRYHFVNAMLLNEVQKQQRLVEEQQKISEEQEKTIARQQAEIQDMTTRLARLEALAGGKR